MAMMAQQPVMYQQQQQYVPQTMMAQETQQYPEFTGNDDQFLQQ
jgi:hypothetical protein